MRRNKRNDSGYVLVLVAIASMALILVVGLALDSASWYLQASRMQRAADSAAMAASSKLPDHDLALDYAKRSLAANGIVEGPEYAVKIDLVGDSAYVTATKRKARSSLLRAVIPSISLERRSAARKSSSQPILGSPFNVLGSGGLNIPGIPQQNFWLAINGSCSPAEDGDLFTAAWDKTKGPFDTSSQLDAEHPYEYAGSSAVKTHCKYGPQTAGNPPIAGAQINPYYVDRVEAGLGDVGYSYYIDIPPPPASVGSAGTVKIALFDPSFSADGAHWLNVPEIANDDELKQEGDITSAFDPYFRLYNTHGDDDISNDTPVRTMGFYSNDHRENATASGSGMDAWQVLAVLSGNAIANGGTYRVQVGMPSLKSTIDDFASDTSDNFPRRGINTFAIGAFPSWLPSTQPGCDTRDPVNGATCPRVYARGAMSVSVVLPDSVATTTANVPLYFAELEPDTAGTPVTLYLWDPGESVEGISIVGPGDTPLTFSYKTSDGAFSGTGVTSIDTKGGGGVVDQYLTSRYKFNDRLLSIDLTVPTDWASIVSANGGDKWVKLRYVVANNARDDRTTWGISFGQSGFSPPHLVEQ